MGRCYRSIIGVGAIRNIAHVTAVATIVFIVRVAATAATHRHQEPHHESTSKKHPLNVRISHQIGRHQDSGAAQRFYDRALGWFKEGLAELD